MPGLLLLWQASAAPLVASPTFTGAATLTAMPTRIPAAPTFPLGRIYPLSHVQLAEPPPPPVPYLVPLSSRRQRF